jgi:signal transduction histidine kinase
VNQVLDVSKIEAGKLDLHKSEINLKKLLEQSLSIMDSAAARNIHLTTKIEEIPETIIADELRVKQIVYNLLSNAMKFTKDGGNICLGARMIVGPEMGIPAEIESLGDEVEISVVDTGIGIRKEDVEKIFEPFSQLESSLSRRYPGTGLGLSLTRSLVEMHGGRIWVESDGPGKGSSFRFTLPIQ